MTTIRVILVFNLIFTPKKTVKNIQSTNTNYNKYHITEELAIKYLIFSQEIFHSLSIHSCVLVS
mgnify:CR=1 FL=1